MIDLDAWQRQRWQREQRYYEVRIEQDLWCEWVVTRLWGRIDSAQGRHRREPVPDLATALARLTAIAKRRRQHGYEPA